MGRFSFKKPSKVISNIDMTSLIDLTFLLLITFIIAMPALEQSISLRLPQGKTDTLPERRTNVISVNAQEQIFLNNNLITIEELERALGNMAAENPDTAVLVRADERLDYGKVMSVVKILYKVRITRLALVTLAE